MKNAERRRLVCLFGLSADPVTGHEGHVGIVQALQKQQEFDEIWVLPVYRHTFTEKRQRLASFEHRLNMCLEAFADMKGVIVSDAERLSWEYAVKDIADDVEKAEVSVGTASLLDYLKQRNADTDFSFCLGADTFLDLMAGKWRESSRVLEHLQGGKRLVVLHRSSSNISNTSTEESELELSRQIKRTGARLLQIGQLGSISSSQVRECRDQEQLATMVVPAVFDYIVGHGLYQFATNAKDNIGD